MLATSIRFTNDILEVPRLGQWLEEISRKHELGEDRTFQLNLALEEALSNVMLYAYPGEQGRPIELSCRKEGACLVFLLQDEGIAFDPTQVQVEKVCVTSAEEQPLGGMGILLLREYAKDIHYQREGKYNLLTITFEI